jgi:hypothetical protein
MIFRPYWLRNGRFLVPSLLAAATALSSYSRAEEKRIADADIVPWVTKRVQDWQPTAAERRFDEIGWVQDIRTAERLAKEHNRPVFLFIHHGRMAVGRC